MTLGKTLENYILARQKYKEAKHELGEAEIRLEMECRKVSNSYVLVDKSFRLLATILLDKLQ